MPSVSGGADLSQDSNRICSYAFSQQNQCTKSQGWEPCLVGAGGMLGEKMYKQLVDVILVSWKWERLEYRDWQKLVVSIANLFNDTADLRLVLLNFMLTRWPKGLKITQLFLEIWEQFFYVWSDIEYTPHADRGNSSIV